MVTQVSLLSGETHLMCWVDKTVYVGNVLTLKEHPGIDWTVTGVYASMEKADINRGWNNNI